MEQTERRTAVILVVEDDLQIGNLLEEVLSRAGYAVLRAYSGTEAALLMKNEAPRPDLVILDLMLPGLSGEELLSHFAGIPVIVCSAKAGVDDKVNLLMGGAVDYVTKPFHTKELLARVAVHLRQSPLSSSPVYTSGRLTLDPANHAVTVDGTVLPLTKTEYAILKLLMGSAGRVVTKSAILDRISEDTPDCTERSLKQHISNLRKKLAPFGLDACIESVWGIGFLFHPATAVS